MTAQKTQACKIVLVLVSFTALAQDTALPPGPLSMEQRMQASAARQQAAALRMAPSIDRQKQAVRRHVHQEIDVAAPATSTGAAPADDFFNLPPPPRNLTALVAPDCDALPPQQVDQLVESAASRENVEPGLIRAVMKTESGYRPCAFSAKGAMGLMQLMPETAADLSVSDPLDPQENVNAGTKLLKELMKRYDGDLNLALSAYNAGPAKVDRTMSVPAIPETLNYLAKIRALYPLDPVVGPQFSREDTADKK